MVKAGGTDATGAVSAPSTGSAKGPEALITSGECQYPVLALPDSGALPTPAPTVEQYVALGDWSITFPEMIYCMKGTSWQI